MKAKEIVAKIRQKLDSGDDAHETFIDELVTDVHRMRAQNEERKGQEAALIRLMKEYNQKWNSVIAQINLFPEFQINGKAYIRTDDFLAAVLQSVRPSGVDIEDDKALILNPQSVTNQALRWHKIRSAQAKAEKAMAVSDPVLQYLKTTLGL